MNKSLKIKQFKFVGGSIIGFVRYTFPLAVLEISKDKIVLNEILFLPEDVVKIIPYGKIPILNPGVQIVHNRDDIPVTIAFLYPFHRNKIFESIIKSGFVAKGIVLRRPKGIPIKLGVLVPIILMYNVLFLRGKLAFPNNPLEIWTSGGPFFGFSFLFLISTIINLSPKIQSFIVTKNRSFGELKDVFILLNLSSALLAFVGWRLWLNKGL
ncbi:MAG: hypothetical protein ACXVCE_12005 [Bacteriovorax sp.]